MKYNVIKYPDGSQYVQITDFTDNLTFRINSYSDLWTLKQIKDVCDYNKLAVHLTIPALFDAQADRRFNWNESSGLKLVCQFINDMKWTSVSIFHPHNQELVEGLINNVKIIDNSDFIKKVIYNLQLEQKASSPEGLDYIRPLEDLILLSTDGGSYKWINKLADKIGWEGEVYGASKSRKYEGGESKLIQIIDKQDFEGKDLLVLDDLSIYGGTFVGLAKMLKERNCGKLYLAVSHLTVSKPNPELFNLFDKVFTTNSKGLDYLVSDSKGEGETPKNLEIINLF